MSVVAVVKGERGFNPVFWALGLFPYKETLEPYEASIREITDGEVVGDGVKTVYQKWE